MEERTRANFHPLLPDWACEAYERVAFDFPCWACDEDRYREYGATTKTDDDVRARWQPPRDDRCPDCGCNAYDQCERPDCPHHDA